MLGVVGFVLPWCCSLLLMCWDLALCTMGCGVQLVSVAGCVGHQKFVHLVGPVASASLGRFFRVHLPSVSSPPEK